MNEESGLYLPMSNRPVLCPSCRRPLRVCESEVETDGFMKPSVFSCAGCGHFLGISPYVNDLESQVADIHSAVGALRAKIEKSSAAAPTKKKK
jgi:hypothetical protein